MNYLAHLYLAEDSPESLVGNFLGDFVKGQAINLYSDAIQKGIKLHRKVDSYTDSHPIFLKSKRLISNLNKRYAGIIIDVFYDHFLAKNWSHYSGVPLNEYAAKVYRVLQENQGILPDSLRTILPYLIADNRLVSYAEIPGISFTLKRISLRLKRENSLDRAIEDLIANYEGFESDFTNFFPEIIHYVSKLR